MKRIFLSLLLVLVFCFSAFGASSDDMSVYVRQDVLNERDRAFMAEIRLGFEQMRREMQGMKTELHQEIQDVKTELHQEIQDVKTELHQEIQDVKTELHREMDKRFNEVHQEIQKVDKKIDNVRTELKTEIQVLNSKVDSLNERTESTKTMIYWILGLLAAIVALPYVQKFLQWQEEKKEKTVSFTLDDVRSLVEEMLRANNLTVQGK